MSDNVIIYEWFANFVIEKPNKRKRYVNKVINKGPYSFEKDYYSIFRAKLISAIKKNKSLIELNNMLKKINPRKYNHYEVLIDQIQNFMQGVKYIWVEPPKNIIEYSGLQLKVNPEIGININGETLFIKMYFKQEQINTKKVNVMLKIMQDSIKEDYPNAKVAILDIRHCELHKRDVNEEVVIPYNLDQEAKVWQKYVEENN